MLGDFLACACCTRCAIMQDAREIKKNGLGYKTMHK